MKFKDNINYLSSGASWLFTLVQTNQLLQSIMFVLSIVSTLFTIAYTVYRWYNKAKEDGKITLDEVKELHDETKDDVEKLKDIMQSSKEDKK